MLAPAARRISSIVVATNPFSAKQVRAASRMSCLRSPLAGAICAIRGLFSRNPLGMTSAFGIDVNVLVYAHRKDVEHPSYRPLLERLANGQEPLRLPDIVLSGFIRLMTNRRISPSRRSPTRHGPPLTPTDRPGGYGAAARSAALDGVSPTGERHQRTSRRYCGRIPRRLRLREQRDWLSADPGCARFHRLRWSHPADQ
jgi:predicted nucleic acid-binding protein